mgnify:CR=1 FL=1
MQARGGGGSTFFPYLKFANPVLDHDVVGDSVEGCFSLHVADEKLGYWVEFGGVMIAGEGEFRFGGASSPGNVFREGRDSRGSAVGLAEVFTVAIVEVGGDFFR